MSKVIVKFPYYIKKDLQKEHYDLLKKQWEDGLLVIDGSCFVEIRPDTDILVVEFKEEEDG